MPATPCPRPATPPPFPPMAMLDPNLVLGAYAVGVFPMADARDASDVYWVEPKTRAVLPLDGFRLSRSLRQTVAADRFRVTADHAFGRVVQLCAESVEGRPETWINAGIERVFATLHARGLAHSIECWEGEEMVGGHFSWPASTDGARPPRGSRHRASST